MLAALLTAAPRLCHSLVSSLSASGSIGLMMALALGSLGALCTACYYINGVAAFSRSGVSGALFSFGGAYGHKRPISEVTFNTVCASLLGLSALGFCDFVYARHTKVSSRPPALPGCLLLTLT
eukprot:scaffold7500_cov127-Isochrysis_galbana.AAC.25